MSSLSETELAVLDLERRQWHRRGAKEVAVRRELGLTVTRYSQLVNALIDRPEALAVDPVTVNRLRRLREQRRALRTTRRGEA